MLKITSQGEGYSFWKGLVDKKVLFGFAVFAGLFLAFWYFNPLVVVVTGTGEVSAIPEKARVSYLVTDLGANVDEAVSKVNAKQNLLRSKISGNFSVSDSNITESQVSVIPPSLSQNLNQYAASKAVDVKVDDYMQVSSLVSALYSGGASYVSQPVLIVEDTKKLEEQAYKLAVRDADSKASAIGKRHFRFLRKRVSISVVASNSESVATNREVLDKGNQSNQQTPLVSDSFKMTSLVTITYKMW
jgi:uncharacterized protein YggE